MSGKSAKVINEFGIKFKFKELITKERKEKLEKHPQASKSFRFKRSLKMFRWYIRFQDRSGKPNRTRNTCLFKD